MQSSNPEGWENSSPEQIAYKVSKAALNMGKLAACRFCVPLNAVPTFMHEPGPLFIHCLCAHLLLQLLSVPLCPGTCCYSNSV